MYHEIFTSHHEKDSFYMTFKSDVGCGNRFPAQAFIRNKAGWKCSWWDGDIIYRSHDCVAICDLDCVVRSIKEDLQGDPNQDRFFSELDLLHEAGSRLFRDEVARFEEMKN